MNPNVQDKGANAISAPLGSSSHRVWRYSWLAMAFAWACVVTAFFCTIQPPAPVGKQLNVWEWFWSPNEQFSVFRLPYVNYEFAICSTPDGKRAWAVGGAIVATSDGGATWKRQGRDLIATLKSVSFAADGRRGWAVGDSGAILATTDGGATWERHGEDLIETLNSVSFAADGRRGWAVGNSGVIVATTDGGATWTRQDSGTTEPLNSVSFAADGRRGCAVGDSGAILATTDGGTTWTRQDSGATEPLNSVSFAADGARGWAVGDSGAILATTDGGTTWTRQDSGTKVGLCSVSFAADGRRGWAVGNSGVIVATIDGGATWKSQNSGATEDLTSVSFGADGLRGWAVRTPGTILGTADGGVTWVQLTQNLDFSSVNLAANGQVASIVGYPQVILSTTDGGASWKSQNSGTKVRLNSVSFAADGRRGWAVGDSGAIVATTDGGASWKSQNSGTKVGLKSVSFAADGARGWAVGDSGAIVATTDGGATWTRQDSGTTEPLNSVSFAADGRRGCAVGDSGAILATTDGGATWKPQNSGTTLSLYSVSFTADGLRGWAVGNIGAIVATTDGGTTWKSQDGDPTEFFNSVSFAADGLRGWAVGSTGVILATTDGGATWKPQDSGTKVYLSSVRFAPEGLRGWAVGNFGVILATKDAGVTWTQVNLYRRSPAPAFLVFLALTFVPIWFATREFPIHESGKGIAEILISDRVLTERQAAGTQVGALAEGLADYLENPRTQAPLVIGITGPWGSGKSSLMNLLRDALRAKRFQVAWFNAWHHQSEEHLFASLLTSLRSKALPPLWTALGVRARQRLFLERCRRMWLRLLLGFAGAIFIWTVVPPLFVDPAKVLDWSNLDKLLTSLAIPAAGLPVIALWKMFSAFGVDPAKLAKVLRGSTVAEAREATSLRERFAEEFGEVTRALKPHNLTIFIDDLDRCHPDQVLLMLEAVNFLASSGDCYIVLGMEQEVLVHCLEQKLDWLTDLPLPLRVPQAKSRARLWLDKIVQLRVSVPPLLRNELEALLSPDTAGDLTIRRPPLSDLARIQDKVPVFLNKGLGALVFAALIGIVATIAVQLGIGYVDYAKKNPETKETKLPDWVSAVELTGKVNNNDLLLHLEPKTLSASPSETGRPTQAPTVPKTGPIAPPAKEHAIDSNEIGSHQTAPLNWVWIGAAGLLVLTGAWRVLAIRDLTSVSDSPIFEKTLTEFEPCIATACQTPRAVKQLINRIRLYAMLLRRWSLNKDKVEGATKRLQAGQEADLVIFGIMEKLCPNQLRSALEDPGEASFQLEAIDPGLSKFNDRAAQAIRSLTDPDSKQDFERLVRSIETDEARPYEVQAKDSSTVDGKGSELVDANLSEGSSFVGPTR